ncbi:hypothetical protein C8Q77DRAFT_1162009 [Trametes polyzona]|nr:hypothetical protein C8Q77DRAFT_1162009 [Trametes polyzona]
MTREPASPGERLLTALREGTGNGDAPGQTDGEEIHDNVHIDIFVEEQPGAVDGGFQDLSTYKLKLRLEPVLYIRSLVVIVEECNCYPEDVNAPFWLRYFDCGNRRSLRTTRTYMWLQEHVRAVSPPTLKKAMFMPEAWAEVKEYLDRIEAIRAYASGGVRAAATSDESLHEEEWLTLPAETRPSDSQEEICEDDWEDKVEPGNSPEPPVLQSPSAPTPPYLAATSLVTPSFPLAEPPRVLTPEVPIPLKADAMARLEESRGTALETCRPGTPPAASRPLTLHAWHPSVLLAMLLAAWLHIIAHLPFRFCNVLLSVIGLILAEAGQGSLVPALRTSLSGCLSILRLEPSFKTYTTCTQCYYIEPHRTSLGAGNWRDACPECGHPLYRDESPPEPSPGKVRKRSRKKDRTPKLCTPFKSIEEQLADLLLLPGMEDALLGWRRWSRLSGWLFDFFDGLIARSLLGYDGLPFFRFDLKDDPDGEIRIAVALCLDWFSYLRSLISPSHTSCPMSICILNLPAHLRFRASNLLLTMIIPGPKETDPDQTQKFLGVAAFTPGGFVPRTDAQHRFLMNEYLQQATKKGKDDYASLYATRWSELARLPYFDMCRMIVIDPMHNLFLGLVKSHFYHIWVQLRIFRKSKEIRRMHEILSQLNLPSRLGRLPRLVGEPAGGSLTADQWLNLATVVAPLALPELWDCCSQEDKDEFIRRRQQLIHKKVIACRESKARQTRPQLRQSDRARRPTEKAKDLVLESDDDGAIDISDNDAWIDDPDDNDDSSSPTNLHSADLSNFLKLCAALRLFLSDKISNTQLSEADKLIREYCIELVELYGEDVIRPNHHYATHTAEFIRDYGPMREFWTFLFERLNKLLKAYKTSNHNGGEVECTFFREFHRMIQLQRLLTVGMSFDPTSSIHMGFRALQDASLDHRGTLQQLANELDDTHRDDGVTLELSPRFSTEPMDHDVYYTLLEVLRARYPSKRFHTDIALGVPDSSSLLTNRATFFDYAVVAGQRYPASARASSQTNSLAMVRVSEAGRLAVGEVRHIIMYETYGVPRQFFAFVRWFRPARCTFEGTPWHAVPSVFCLQLWDADSFIAPAQEPSPAPQLVPLSDLISPVACYKTKLHGMAVQITMPLRREPVL